MDTNRERQAAELTLLSTMYPSEFSWLNNPPLDLTQPNFPDPSFTLTLHPSYTLEFTLPPTYPSTSKPTVYLTCGDTIDTRLRKQARASLASLVSTQDPDLEILDLIVTGFQDLLPSLTSQTPTSPTTTDSPTPASSKETAESGGTVTIKRAVIWSHHLLATSKRKDIQSWSKELDLDGFARPGHPGSIFVEGTEDSVDEFVRRLKQLRWQALQVRGEETAERRLLGGGDGVVEVEGLGDIAERLKVVDVGCADLFLQAMKIAKTD